jgi:hypothetical protein
MEGGGGFGNLMEKLWDCFNELLQVVLVAQLV